MLKENQKHIEHKIMKDNGEIVYYNNRLTQQKIHDNYLNDSLANVRKYYADHGKLCLVEKYIRQFDSMGHKQFNINRNKGFFNEDNNCCFIVGDLLFSHYVDKLEYFHNLIQEAILESRVVFDQHASDYNSADEYQAANYKAKLILECEPDFRKIIQQLIDQVNIEYKNLTENDLKLDRSEYYKLRRFALLLKCAGIWSFDSINRVLFNNILQPGLKAGFYFLDKIIDKTKVNMVDVGQYWYHMKVDIMTNSYTWIPYKNPDFNPDYTVLNISSEIERYVTPENLKSFICVVHEKTCYEQLGEIDIEGKLLESDYDCYLPIKINVHGKLYKLVGVFYREMLDGGHTITLNKIVDKDYWQLNDEFYSLKIYEDSNLNVIGNRTFSLEELLIDITPAAYMMFYELVTPCNETIL